MRRFLPLLLFLASCSKGPEADLPAISQARSLIAEWALVNELGAQHKVTSTYATVMRKRLRQQLGAIASSLNQPDSQYAEEIRAGLGEQDGASPQVLREHASRLKAVEDALESA